MAGPPNIFIIYLFYKLYLKRFERKNGEYSEKQPLSFGLWLLRFIGIIVLVVAVVGLLSWLISTI